MRLHYENGELVKWAWPGGYPVFYFDSDFAPICADCARKWEDYSTSLVASDINWEDARLTCDNCGQSIEAAYEDEGE